MNTLEKIALTVVLLGTLIFVHELGHFLMAKLFRVKVLKFSLGFGPKLLGFTWGETEYRISALPLGGYVRMAGEDPSEGLNPQDKGRSFFEQSPWKRALIGIAGPGMNLLFPALVFFVAFYFQPTEISSRIGQVFPGQPAYFAGLQAGDRITEIDSTPVRYFYEVQRLIEPRPGQQISLTYERQGASKTIHLVPAKVESQTPIETVTRGVIGISPSPSAPLVGIAYPQDSPAAQAGLQTFDRIVRVGKTSVSTYPELRDALAKHLDAVEVTVVRDVPEPGIESLTTYRTLKTTLTPKIQEGKSHWGIEPTDLYVFSVEEGSPAWNSGLRRGDRLVEVAGKPLPGWQTLENLRLQQKERSFSLVFIQNGVRIERNIVQKQITRVNRELGSQRQEWWFGATPDQRWTRFVDAEKISNESTVFQALNRSLRIVPEEIQRTAMVVGYFVQGKLSPKNLGGPLMMYDVASRAANVGWDYFLQIMALISINLGIMNLLPIPVLDGFLILSSGIEIIRKRPLSLQARAIANYIGIAMLLSLMVYAFINDIQRMLP